LFEHTHEHAKEQILVHRKSKSYTQIPLHYVKVGVWCRLSVKRITGSLFCAKTISFKRYVWQILQPFLRQITKKNYEHFQPHSPTVNANKHSIQILNTVFVGRAVISILTQMTEEKRHQAILQLCTATT
jgi:hypothetical protein